MFLGLCGYFDLTIDSSNVSLAFGYTVTASVCADSDITDAKIVGYSFPGSSNTITYLNNSTPEVHSSAAASVNSSVIRVYVVWDDDDSTQQLNDVEDTLIATSAGEAKIQVSVLFEQQIN